MSYYEYEKECRARGVLENTIPEEIRLVPNDLPLRVKTVATIFNTSEETVRRWCRDGELDYLRGSKIYKITGRDVKEFWYKKNIKKQKSI